jgi:Matrixin
VVRELHHRPLRAAALGVAALASIAALAPARASAFCRTTTTTKLTDVECRRDGIPLAWDRQCISFTVEDPGESGPTLGEARDAADRAFATWSAVECDGAPIGIDLRQTQQLADCAVPQHDRRGPNMNAIVFVEDWAGDDDLPPDAFAVTLTWNLKATGEIVDVDMLLNPTLGLLANCGDACPRVPVTIDLQNVITHEAGHFLGLSHSDVRGSTMSASAREGELEKRSLELDDIAGVCAIYGQLPPAQCNADRGDFVPDRGFSTRCATRQPSGGCSVSTPAAAERGSYYWLLALAIVIGWSAKRGKRRNGPGPG